MFRFWNVFDEIIDELMDAAEAMADGSYWDDGNNGPPVDDYYEYRDPADWG